MQRVIKHFTPLYLGAQLWLMLLVLVQCSCDGGAHGLSSRSSPLVLCKLRDCTDRRSSSTFHSHPPSPVIPIPGKHLTAAPWDSAHQEHHGPSSFRSWTLGLSSTRVSPGDAAAPDSITLKRCCRWLRRPKAPRGLHWGDSTSTDPPMGAAKWDKHLEDSALPLPWMRDAPR